MTPDPAIGVAGRQTYVRATGSEKLMNVVATGQRYDPYPTRLGAQEILSQRRDPVVYGGEGPLDAEQLRLYERDGYLMVDNLFSEAVIEECVEELHRLSTLEEISHDPRVILEPGSDEIKSIFEIHTFSNFFNQLVTSPPLVEWARQILDSDVYIHQTRVNKKPAFVGTEWYWHSDFESWHAEDGMPRMRAFSVQVAISENLAVNGPLMIIPGSHNTFVACSGSTPEENYRTSLVRQEAGLPSPDALRTLVGDREITQFLAPPGGAVLFDSNCMHGSVSNMTPHPRTNLFVVFNSVENVLVEPFAASAPRPRHLAAREFTPV
jgi:ectoine hydroxylase